MDYSGCCMVVWQTRGTLDLTAKARNIAEELQEAGVSRIEIMGMWMEVLRVMGFTTEEVRRTATTVNVPAQRRYELRRVIIRNPSVGCCPSHRRGVGACDGPSVQCLLASAISMAARELCAFADHPGSEFPMSNHKRPGIRLYRRRSSLHIEACAVPDHGARLESCAHPPSTPMM